MKLPPLYVVANSLMLRRFRSIDIFKVNLGMKMFYDDGIKLSDVFIIQYWKLFNKTIYRYGDIGDIKFYEDFSMTPDTFTVYKEKDVYEVIYSDDDKKKPIKVFLTEIVTKIASKDYQTTQNTMEGMEIFDEAKIKEMEGGIARPSMKLSKEEYIRQMVERRQKLTPFKKQTENSYTALTILKKKQKKTAKH